VRTRLLVGFRDPKLARVERGQIGDLLPALSVRSTEILWQALINRERTIWIRDEEEDQFATLLGAEHPDPAGLAAYARYLEQRGEKEAAERVRGIKGR
jgi:hypothetical protein